MKIFSIILSELKNMCNLYCILLIIAVGLFTFFVDGKRLKESKDNKDKDSKIARVIGLIYIIGGPVLFIVVKFI